MNHMKISAVVAATIVASILSFSAPTYAAEKHVMVFGDSNSWCWTPSEKVYPTQRYPENVCWVGVMTKILGQGFEVVNESLPARTTAVTDPALATSLGLNGTGLNGLEYLPAALASNMPLDLVVIMLGTNDVMPNLKRSALDISLDIMRLVSVVQKSTGVATAYPPAKVLVVVPPHLGKLGNVTGYADFLKSIFPEASAKESAELAGVVCPLASAIKVPCFDAETVAEITGIDGIHMTPENHQKLGTAVAAEVRKILP
jgi:lysophospholipase L1-like esterase